MIYCVEDERNIRELLVYTLHSTGFEAKGLENGTQLFEELGNLIPDLILLDYEMPIVNGAQVMQMIRGDNDFKDIPIVFLTGKNDLNTVQNIVSLKPEGYILKDTKPKELHETIDRYLLD